LFENAIDGETHYAHTVRYSSVGLAGGPSGNPDEGGLLIYYNHDRGELSFGWYITDTKVYVYILLLGYNLDIPPFIMTWMVPVADRLPWETDRYEIVISKSAATMSYRMNDREVFRLKGNQGIDPKFRIWMQPFVPPFGVWPKLNKDTFDGKYTNTIWLGDRIGFTTFFQFQLPPCLNTTYNQCIDRNPGYAPNAQCVYAEAPQVPPNAGYEAQFEQIQAFVVKKTKFCSTDDGPRAWWRPCPCRPKLDEMEESNYAAVVSNFLVRSNSCATEEQRLFRL
jgi:hypothetical protein